MESILSDTVESHVGAVLRKLQLNSRNEVTHWAARRGLIGREHD
jgi:DNA-binding CsgD family transcriptional regulator